MPDLNELSKELDKKNDAIILAVDSQESAKTVKNFVSSNKLDLKVLLDEDGSITSAFSKYGLEGYPTTYVLNTDGSLYTYIPGATTKDVLLEILEKIRNGKPLK